KKKKTNKGMWFIEYVGLLYTANNETTLNESNGVWVDTCKDSDPCLALLDSGTSYITMPSKEYNTLVDNMSSVGKNCWNSYGQFICPESALSSLPNLWIQIHKKAFILTPQDYMIEDACTSKEGYFCLAISAIDQMGDHTYIFGDTFLRNYYVIFDETNNRLGFGSMHLLDDALKRPSNVKSLFSFSLALLKDVFFKNNLKRISHGHILNLPLS
ncbi:pepsin A preproprotein, partial [Reticulomyxa filosa]